MVIKSELVKRGCNVTCIKPYWILHFSHLPFVQTQKLRSVLFAWLILIANQTMHTEYVLTTLITLCARHWPTHYLTQRYKLYFHIVSYTVPKCNNTAAAMYLLSRPISCLSFINLCQHVPQAPKYYSPN